MPRFPEIKLGSDDLKLKIRMENLIDTHIDRLDPCP